MTMKKYYFSFLIIFSGLAISLSSCKKEFETDNVSHIVKVSYPTIELKGAQAASIPVGGTYADEGAILTDDITGAKTDIMAKSFELDPSQPGVGFAVYEASNSNGFTTRVVRPIAVTNVSENAPDLSGDYHRTSNNAPVTWTKLAKGLYLNNNVGGSTSPSGMLPVYVIQDTDTSFIIPEQDVPGGYGTLSVSDVTLSVTSSDTTYSYIVQNPYFLDNVRTFTKP